MSISYELSGKRIYVAGHRGMVGSAIVREGEIVHDLTESDGTPRKLMAGDKLRAMGWQLRIGLEQGIAAVCRSYLEAAAPALA